VKVRAELRNKALKYAKDPKYVSVDQLRKIKYDECMSKEMTVIALGILVALVPYLGIPGSWRTVFLLIVGLGTALIGFLLRGEAVSRGSKHTDDHPFIESSPEQGYGQKEGIDSTN
jgi:hypothetical protein